MATAIGIWFALAGAVGLLAGWAGMRRVRRLRRGGVKSWALAVLRPSGSSGLSGDADERRLVLQYKLADGRVLEKLVAGAAGWLHPGRSVLIWYDSGDPQDVLVYGREGRMTDLGFATIGLLFMLLGVAIAVAS